MDPLVKLVAQAGSPAEASAEVDAMLATPAADHDDARSISPSAQTPCAVSSQSSKRGSAVVVESQSKCFVAYST